MNDCSFFINIIYSHIYNIAILVKVELQSDYYVQTESDIMREFERAGVEVANRMFQTVDKDPTDNIRDLFVSLGLSRANFK